jgi:uncharacterized protein
MTAKPVFTPPPFDPPRWLRNAHLQTLIASRKPRRWEYGWTEAEPVEFDLAKDGKLIGMASWQPSERRRAPALILFHGLEGSAESHYLVGMSRKAYAKGFHTIRINTRNCGGTEHLTPTLYCAGLSQDVLRIVEQLPAKQNVERIYAGGVSLGANILLKFLGEQGENGGELVRGAAVLSPPIDLAAGVRRMERPENWIYQRYFVGKLIERMRKKTALYPGIADMRRVERVRTIYEFDDVVTAPHFGFGSADNYYRLASCGPLLANIRTPTLIIQAQDDPMIPFEPFTHASITANGFVTLLATRHGGHTGFYAPGRVPAEDQDGYWGESRVVQFLAALEGI